MVTKQIGMGQPTYFDISDLLSIPGKLVLRSMTDEDKTFFIMVSGGYNTETIGIHGSKCIFQIEFYEKFHSKGEDMYDKITAQVIELITALRLLKDGYIGPALIVSRHPLMNDQTVLQPSDYDIRRLIPKFKDGEVLPVGQYWLGEAEISSMRTIVGLLRRISNKSKDLALRHFNSAYERKNPDDKFLDLMIAYEALFSEPDSKSDSVTHKLALRFSKLLGKNIDEAKLLRTRMKTLYGTRSAIVHGGEVPLEYETVEELFSFIRRSEDGTCFAQTFINGTWEWECPKDYHSEDDDETGQCYLDTEPYYPGQIRYLDFAACGDDEYICKKHNLTSCTVNGRSPNEYCLTSPDNERCAILPSYGYVGEL